MAEKAAETDRYYLMCERDWIYHILITVAGFYWSVHLSAAGQCVLQCSNRQRGAHGHGLLAAGNGGRPCIIHPHFRLSAGFLYFGVGAGAGQASFSPALGYPADCHEMLVVLILGFVPESAPVQISQVAINFIASMQYNTFRQSQGTPMGHYLCHQSHPTDRHWGWQRKSNIFTPATPPTGKSCASTLKCCSSSCWGLW